jgi:hypothetical protein
MTWKRPLYWKTPLASLRGSARSLPLASSVTLLMIWSVAQRDLLAWAGAASRSGGALTRWRVCFDCKLALLAAVGEAAGGGAGRIDAGQDARQAGRDGSEEHGGRVRGGPRSAGHAGAYYEYERMTRGALVRPDDDSKAGLVGWC